MFAVLNGAGSFLSAKRENGALDDLPEGFPFSDCAKSWRFSNVVLKRTTKIFTKFLNARAERVFRFMKSYISPPSHYRRRRFFLKVSNTLLLRSLSTIFWEKWQIACVSQPRMSNETNHISLR